MEVRGQHHAPAALPQEGDGPQKLYGRVENRKIFSHLPGLEPLTVQKVSPITIPTTVSRILRHFQSSTNPMTYRDSGTRYDPC